MTPKSSDGLLDTLLGELSMARTKFSESRRDFARRMAYAAPVVATIAVVPRVASAGSLPTQPSKPLPELQPPVEPGKKRTRRKVSKRVKRNKSGVQMHTFDVAGTTPRKGKGRGKGKKVKARVKRKGKRKTG